MKDDIPADTGSADPGAELRLAAITAMQRHKAGSPGHAFWRVTAGIWDRWAERSEMAVELSSVARAEFQAALFSARKYLELQPGGSEMVEATGAVCCVQCGYLFISPTDTNMQATELGARLTDHVCADTDQADTGPAVRRAGDHRQGRGGPKTPIPARGRQHSLHGMFVSDQVTVEASFADAQARLSDLVRNATLEGVSEDAYGAGATALMRVGPTPAISRLVRAEFRELVSRGDTAVLTLRWEAAGPRGGLFPVLDADITLAPAGETATLLRIDGAYRPPLGSLGAGLDRALFNRVATATIRDFVSRIAQALNRTTQSTSETESPATTR